MKKKKLRKADIRVRKVRPADWPAVFKIYESGFGLAHDGLKDSEAVVAVFGKKVVGFALLDVKEDEVYISNVGVHPKHQGRGICGKLMKKIARKFFPDYQRPRLTLMVARDNKAAVACYRSVGFRPVGDESGGFSGSMMDMEYRAPAKKARCVCGRKLRGPSED